MSKLIVVGLDGASFELIGPWIEDGSLPNLAKIKKEGAWADMKCVLPPVTSPNWKCFSTGKNPGKLGIFWWENIDWINRRVYYPTSRKFKNKEIWEYLSEAGYKVGVLGMPTTYPPKEVDGFMVSCGPDAEDSGFTYPPELEKTLKRKRWKSNHSYRIDIDREKACSEIHEIIDQHFKVAKELDDRYGLDFLMVATFHINVLQHFLWDAPETKKGWEIIDKHLGDFLESGHNIILMSDHGSNKIETVFNINTWLKEEGYLKLNTNLRKDLLYKMGINQRSLAKLANKMRVTEVLGRIPKIKDWYQAIPTESGEVKKEAKTSLINWEKSKALASGQGPIYLNPENDDNKEVREEIKSKLEQLVDPATNKRVVEKVHTKEEIYEGKYLNEAPDLIIDQAKGAHIPGGVGQEEVFGSKDRWDAENKKHGLFMAYGPDIRSGESENVSILDLAPTILHIMGFRIPEDMDGKVLKTLFKEDSDAGEREVVLQSSEKEKIKDQVRDLNI